MVWGGGGGGGGRNVLLPETRILVHQIITLWEEVGYAKIYSCHPFIPLMDFEMQKLTTLEILTFGGQQSCVKVKETVILWL